MTIYFSCFSMGFYDDVMKDGYVESDSWPIDAEPVSDKWYEYLIDGQSKGKIISTNEYGKPVLSDPVSPSSEELIQEAEARKAALMQAASVVMAPLLDALELDKATESEIALLKAWREYRVTLNRLDLSIAPNIEWPEPPC